MHKFFLFISFVTLFVSCREKDKQDNTVEEKIEDAENKLKEMSDSIHFDKALFNNEDVKRGYMIQNGDTIRIKVASYDSSETPK